MENLYTKKLPAFRRIPIMEWNDNAKQRVLSSELERDGYLRWELVLSFIFRDIDLYNLFKDSPNKDAKAIEDLKRIEVNLSRVETACSIDELMVLMCESAAQDARPQLAKKIMEHKDFSIDKILGIYDHPYTDYAFETSLFILYRLYLTEDITPHLLDVIHQNKIRDPEDLNVFLLLFLRADPTEEIFKVIFSYLVFFADNYPEESYREAPLFVLKFFCKAGPSAL